LGGTSTLRTSSTSPFAVRDLLGPFRSDIADMHHRSGDLVGRVALLLRIVYSVVAQLQTRLPDLRVVRHEDLSRSPERNHAELYEALDLSLTEGALETIHRTRSAENPSEITRQDPYASQVDSQVNHWNWKERLTTDEVEPVRSLTKDVAGLYYAEADWGQESEVRARANPCPDAQRAVSDKDARLVKLSVILPFLNAARFIGAQLEALAAQECECAWDVIAVDNCSSDASRRIVEAFQGRLDLRVVNASEKANPSYARNVGASASTGRNLIFLDADDEVAPGYLAAMSNAFDSYEFVTPRLESDALNPEWLRLAHGPPHETELHAFAGFLPFAGGGIGVSRSVFASVGGFSEQLSAGEDIAFSWDVQLAGTPLHFVPGAVLRYRHRETLRGLFQQTRAWGYVLPRLYRNYREAGMPRRPLRAAFGEWTGIVRELGRARTKRDIAPLVVRLGYCVGQLQGSLRHGVLYL
jgi:GT2 family glycosyltransferase